jgi:hypothetical protein
MGLCADGFAGGYVLIYRDAIHCDESQGLRRALKDYGEVEISDGRSVEDAPKLPLPWLHLDDCGRIVRVGDGDVID